MRIHRPSRARSLPRRTVLALLLACASSVSVSARAEDIRTAEQDLLQGRADRAIAALQAVTASNPGNGPAHLLLCRAFLSKLKGSEAADECRSALKAGLANDSAAQDWAGRSFGAEAEHAGPISGLKLAGQVRNAFQTAYVLNRRNAAAANDLGEYFVNAPAIVGGGADKASRLADEIMPALPEIAHRLRALVAERRGDTAQTEQEFLLSTQVAQSPGAYVDLANFYVRQHAMDKAVAAAARSIALNRVVDANVVDAAGALNDANQPSLALQALQAYLDHGRQSDQAPAFRGHTMMGDILVAQGNRVEARRQFQAALALASDYSPARKGLGSL